MRVTWTSTVLGLVAFAACGSSDAPNDPADSPAFGSPEVAGLCETFETELAEGAAGVPTRERAVAQLVDAYSVLSSTTIRGDTISYEGEPVGTVTVVERSAGGFTVVEAEWCYPD